MTYPHLAVLVSRDLGPERSEFSLVRTVLPRPPKLEVIGMESTVKFP